MAMFDFAVLAIKVLFFIWAAQLILLGWLLLRRTVKSGLRSFSEGTSAKKAVQALRSAGVVDSEQSGRVAQ
jgi:hypothetical protein